MCSFYISTSLSAAINNQKIWVNAKKLKTSIFRASHCLLIKLCKLMFHDMFICSILANTYYFCICLTVSFLSYTCCLITCHAQCHAHHVVLVWNAYIFHRKKFNDLHKNVKRRHIVIQCLRISFCQALLIKHFGK